YSQILLLPQYDLEKVMDEALAGQGAKVELARELFHLEAGADGTQILSLRSLNNPTQAEIITARYVIAADGAHSFVRKTYDIPFRGAAYAQDFLLADVDIDWRGASPQGLQVFLSRGGVFALLQLQD